MRASIENAIFLSGLQSTFEMLSVWGLEGEGPVYVLQCTIAGSDSAPLNEQYLWFIGDQFYQ